MAATAQSAEATFKLIVIRRDMVTVLRATGAPINAVDGLGAQRAPRKHAETLGLPKSRLVALRFLARQLVGLGYSGQRCSGQAGSQPVRRRAQPNSWVMQANVWRTI